MTYRWYYEDVRYGQYNSSYITSFLNGNSEIQNTTLGSLREPLRDLVIVIENFVKIPPYLFPNFNMTHWRPVIESFLRAYASDSVSEMLKVLKLLDPVFRNDQFWLDMKKGVEAASQYLEWLNTKLEEIDVQGGNVSIVSLLPNIDEVSHAADNDDFIPFYILSSQLMHIWSPAYCLWKADIRAIYLDGSG